MTLWIYYASIRIKLIKLVRNRLPKSFNSLKLKNLWIANTFQIELLKHKNLSDINIYGFSETANEYWSKLKECLQKSTTSTLQHSRKCAIWVEATVQLSENAAKT